MRRRFIFLSFLFAGLPGWAGPPFLTDDPEPVERHHWEIYSAAQTVKTRYGSAGAAPLFDVNYGVTGNAHLHFLVQGAYDNPADGPARYGYGDTEIGAKIRLLDETTRRPQAAIYPAIEFPTGDDDRGLGAGKTSAFLPLWIQKTFADWTTYGGGGYWVNPGAGRRNWLFLGWVIQRRISDRGIAGAEVFHRTPDADDASASDGFNLGGTYDLSARYHLMVSGGRDFTGPNRFTGYLAIQWTYPGAVHRANP